MENIISELNIVTEIINYNSLLMNAEDGFKKIYEDAKKNIDSTFGDHWTKAQKVKFSDQGRLPVNMPLIFPKAQGLIGFEKENREQVEAQPEGEEDEFTTEIVNQKMRHTERTNSPKYEFIKSEVYTNGIIPCFGASEIYVETDEFKRNVIKIRSIPYNQIIFDLNFTDFEMNTCRRWQRHWHCYLDDLIKEFPDKKDSFDKIEEDFNNSETFPLRDLIQDYYADDKAQSGRKIVKRIIDYKLVNSQVWIVNDIKNQQRYEATSKEEAESTRDELMQKPTQDGSQLLETDFEIESEPRELVEVTEIAGNTLIQEPTIQKYNPTTLYFSIFILGKWFTPVGIMRNVQEFMDRLFSQVDYSIGIDSKGGAEVDVNLISEEWNTVDQIKAAYTEGGLVFKDGQGRLLNPIERTGANAQYFTIFELFFKMLEDGFGGRNFQGASEGANQSGIAVNQLLKVAQILSNNYLDNLRRYDLQVADKMIKYMKEYCDYDFDIPVDEDSLPEKLLDGMKQAGAYKQSTLREGKGWLKYDKKNPKLKPITDTAMTLYLSSVSSRVDEKELTRATLLQMRDLGYDIPPDAILDTMPIKATLKQKIVQYNEEMQKKREQMALEQAKLQGYNEMAKNLNDTAGKVSDLANTGKNLISTQNGNSNKK